MLSTQRSRPIFASPFPTFWWNCKQFFEESLEWNKVVLQLWWISQSFLIFQQKVTHPYTTFFFSENCGAVHLQGSYRKQCRAIEAVVLCNEQSPFRYCMIINSEGKTSSICRIDLGLSDAFFGNNRWQSFVKVPRQPLLMGEHSAIAIVPSGL